LLVLCLVVHRMQRDRPLFVFTRQSTVSVGVMIRAGVNMATPCTLLCLRIDLPVLFITRCCREIFCRGGGHVKFDLLRLYCRYFCLFYVFTRPLFVFTRFRVGIKVSASIRVREPSILFITLIWWWLLSLSLSLPLPLLSSLRNAFCRALSCVLCLAVHRIYRNWSLFGLVSVSVTVR
jgi:hypothetical protein